MWILLGEAWTHAMRVILVECENGDGGEGLDEWCGHCCIVFELFLAFKHFAKLMLGWERWVMCSLWSLINFLWGL